MARGVADRNERMEEKRLAAKAKPKGKATGLTATTFKHPGHGNQKVHSPKGGLGSVAGTSSAYGASAAHAIISGGRTVRAIITGDKTGALYHGAQTALGFGAARVSLRKMQRAETAYLRRNRGALRKRAETKVAVTSLGSMLAGHAAGYGAHYGLGKLQSLLKETGDDRVTFKHPGHGNQKVHNPKGGLGDARARASAATAAFKKRAASVAKKAQPYAKAAAAGALQAGGGIAVGRGLGKMLNFSGGKKDLALGAGLYVGGARAAQLGTNIGNKLQAGRFSKSTKRKLAAVQTWTRRGVKIANFGIKHGGTIKRVARAAWTGFKRAQEYKKWQKSQFPNMGDFEGHWASGSSSKAVALLLGKELAPYVTALKAKKQQSYDSLRDTAISLFRAAYPHTEGGTYRYVAEVFPGYMVVEEGGKYYKAGYSEEGVEARNQWEEVARVTEWETKEVRAKTFVFKEGDDYRWVLLSSNGYRDRDGELVSTKALEQDVAMWDLQNAPPDPLRWWHVSLDSEHKLGLDLGYTDLRMVHNHTLIESGGFISKEVGEAVYNAQDKLAASIGFRHSPKEPDSDKIFNTVRIFERSLLPKESASNILTHLVVTD